MKNVIIIFFIFSPLSLFAEKSNERTEIQNISASCDSIVEYYSQTALNYVDLSKLDTAKLYLDSAVVYEKKVKDANILGLLHYAFGNYYIWKSEEGLAHTHYYKAISFFDQSGTKKNIITAIYYSLAYSYSQLEDTESLKKVIENMLLLTPKKEDIASQINTYSIVSSYYSLLYKKNQKRMDLLDSILVYNTKVTNLFRTMENPPSEYAQQIAYNYINLALYNLEHPSPDWDAIIMYTNNARQMASPTDTVLMIQYHWLKGSIAIKNKQLEEAEKEFQSQLGLLHLQKNAPQDKSYIDVYNELSQLSEMRGDFKEALEYEKLKSTYELKLNDREKYKTIQELQTQYGVEKKEDEINRLVEKNLFQEKIRWLYMGVIFLLIISAFIAFNWLRIKKKEILSNLKIAQLEKGEAELQEKMKEKQLKQMELEKYQALLDVHFERLALGEKDEELEALKREKKKLDTLILNYSEKLAKYEMEKKDNFTKIIMEELKNSITYSISINEEKKKYIQKLTSLDHFFLTKLSNLSNDTLSISNLKYLLCFALEMDTRHIAECFSVEPKSVRMMRHRIKQKLGLGKNEDLGMFLSRIQAS